MLRQRKSPPCSGYSTVPTDGSLELPTAFSREEERRLLLLYGKKVDAFMEGLQGQGVSEQEFYAKLWEYIETSPVLPNDKVRVIALYNCAVDKRIPYYQIDRRQALFMENEEYQAVKGSIGHKILGKMEYILNADFTQKTERASLLLQMLEELTDDKEKCVFLSCMQSHYEREMMKMQLRHMARFTRLLSDRDS